MGDSKRVTERATERERAKATGSATAGRQRWVTATDNREDDSE